MKNPQEFEIFARNKLFDGVDPEDVRTLYSLSRKVALKAGEVLIKENELGTCLYLIIEGVLQVTKVDSIDNHEYELDTLYPTDMAGEVCFLDRGSRSATLRAKIDTIVLGISYEDLDQFIQKISVYSHISKNIGQRLRTTNNIALQALINESQHSKHQVKMGIFLIYLVSFLCLFAYMLNFLQHWINEVPSSSYIATPLVAIIGLTMFGLIKVSSLKLNEFGINFKNNKQALLDGLLLPIPVMLIGVLVKWILTLYLPYFQGHPIFDFFALIHDPHEKNWGHWLLILSAYWFFMVPIQELLTRGALQGLLEHFLLSKHKTTLSIIISNLIFSTVHLFLPIHFSLIVFFSGLYMGWIYSRTHNLISSILAHSLMGTWALWILGAIIA